MDLIATILLAVQSALPFWESRYAIPLAIQGGYPPALAFAVGFASNLAVVVVLLLLLEPVLGLPECAFEDVELLFVWLFSRHAPARARGSSLELLSPRVTKSTTPQVEVKAFDS